MSNSNFASTIDRSRIRSAADIANVELRNHRQLLPAATIGECLAYSAEKFGDKAAIVHLEGPDFLTPNQTTTYSELAQAVDAAASAFGERAAGGNSVVAIMLPMVPEGLVATWGAQRNGVAVPLNPFLEYTSLATILRRTSATVLVTTRDVLTDRDIDTAQLCAAVPTLLDILYVGPGDSFTDELARHRGRPLAAETDPDRDSMVMPTGGTTGTPKLVRMSQHGQLAIAWNVGALMGSEPDGVIGHGMPNFHCGGSIALALRSAIYGQTLLTLSSAGYRTRGIVENFWEIVERYRMTSTMTTPTTALAILHGPSAPTDTSTLVDYHVGGSTVSTSLITNFHDRYGVWLRECWGGTEFHGTITGHPNDGLRPRVGSAGRALPHARIRAAILDVDGSWVRDCAPGEHGELLIGGPTVCAGYLDDQLDSQFFATGIPGGGQWGRTGDLGTVDGDGFVWVSGRSKDLIIRGGHNIDPRDIEEALATHPAVEMVAAVGRPDRAKGEMPVAYVQLAAGATTDSAELLTLCRDSVQEKAAVPVSVTILAQMPLTPVGKIAKPTLRAMALKAEVREAVWSCSRSPIDCKIDVDDTGLRRQVTVSVDTGAAPDVDIASLEDALGEYEFVSNVQVGTFITAS